MKVLSVIETFCHGGAETVLLDVVLSLPEHHHRVVHFSRANNAVAEATFVKALRSAGIKCIDMHWNSLRKEKLRRRVLNGFRPDVVVFHWWGKDPLIPWIASQRTRRPDLVCVLHHAGISPKAGYDRYVLVTRSQRRQVAHIPASQVQVIPNGVDLERFTHQSEQSGGAEEARRPFVVGRLSGLRDGKIPTDWVRTLKSYRLANTRYVIAGDGVLRKKLRKDARALKVERQVAFPGYISRAKVPALLKSFDVFCYVTSSAVECCPLAILEAMAAGLPIIAEPRGGIPELVVNGKNGLLARSTREVRNHLRRLRDDPILRQRLGQGARATAERFSVAKQIASYRDLLDDVQRRRRARARRRLAAMGRAR